MKAIEIAMQLNKRLQIALVLTQDIELITKRDLMNQEDLLQEAIRFNRSIRESFVTQKKETW